MIDKPTKILIKHFENEFAIFLQNQAVTKKRGHVKWAGEFPGFYMVRFLYEDGGILDLRYNLMYDGDGKIAGCIGCIGSEHLSECPEWVMPI